VRPARTLLVAAIGVAAAVAIAFAVVGTTNRRSTPPAGVTTTPPPSSTTPSPTVAVTLAVPNVIGETESAAAAALERHGFEVTARLTPCSAVAPGLVVAQNPSANRTAARGWNVTIDVCSGSTTTTVPVSVCATEYGTPPSASDPKAPKTLQIATPPFPDPALAGYSDLRGYLPVVAPAGWNCKAIEATDGGQAIGVTPPGATPRDSWGVGGKVTQPPTDGVFAELEPACQGCVAGEICGIVPTAVADFPELASTPCPQPADQTVTPFGHDRYRIDDPPGALGPDAAHSILRYTPRSAHTDASAMRITCILPASQQTVCTALFEDFFARNPPPWTESSLTISPTVLGAVTVGESLFAAQESAGLTFDGQGDGFAYPRSLLTNGIHLYVGLTNAKVSCVGAEIVIAAHAKTQRITTPEGFALGGTVAQLLALYGSRATYVPAPKSGMTTNVGYVVKEGVGALAFAVHQNKVFEIAGGPADLTPNSCTG
jgi:hypothetical protein